MFTQKALNQIRSAAYQAYMDMYPDCRKEHGPALCLDVWRVIEKTDDSINVQYIETTADTQMNDNTLRYHHLNPDRCTVKKVFRVDHTKKILTPLSNWEF